MLKVSRWVTTELVNETSTVSLFYPLYFFSLFPVRLFLASNKIAISFAIKFTPFCCSFICGSENLEYELNINNIKNVNTNSRSEKFYFCKSTIEMNKLLAHKYKRDFLCFSRVCIRDPNEKFNPFMRTFFEWEFWLRFSRNLRSIWSSTNT